MKQPTNDIIPQGYKMTELGVLPEEWEVVKLANLIEEVKEKNKDNEKLKVYTVSNIFGFILSDLFFDKKVYSKELTNYKIIKENYFAYNPYRINVGSIGLFKDYIGLVSPAYIVFKIKKIHELNPNYFFLLLKSSYYTSEIKRMAMSRGSIRRSLSFKDLSYFLIPLPPLPEQQKIAAVLSAVQEAKEKTEAVIAATKALKKSMMKHLFTYGPVSPEETETVLLKETEIGPVPEDWEVVKLGEVARGKITDGTHKTPKYIKTGIPFITITNIVNGQIDFSKCKFISKEEHNSLIKRCMPEKDDVLLSKVGTLGLSAKVNVNYDFSIFVQLALIKPKKEIINSEYLKNLLSSTQMQNQINAKSSQSTMKYIGVEKIANLNIPLPPLPTQQKIASILSAIDAKIEAEENKKKALEELFKSLLHNLMTARIRVNQSEVTL